jgi:hypothetical protein
MTLPLPKITIILSFTLTILLNSEITIAQPSADYFVTNSGDTVAAVIKSKKWDLTPQKIVASVGDSDKKYRPFDIRSFTAGNRTFISAYVKRDVSTICLVLLIWTIQSPGSTAIVFLLSS